MANTYEILYNSTGSDKAPLFRFCRQRWDSLPPSVSKSYEYLKIFLVQQGSACWKIAGREVLIQEGDVILLNNTEQRMLCKLVSAPLVIVYATYLPISVKCSGELLSVFFHHSAHFQNVLPRDHTLRADICALFSMIEKRIAALPTDEGQDDYLRALMKTLFICTAQAFLDISQKSSASSQTCAEEYHLISQVIHYISENPAANLTETALAERFYMSRNRFIHLFRMYNGMTPAAYVRAFRVRYALELLQNGDKSVAEVALECGYAGLSGFYKAVSAVTGTTPLEGSKK